MWVLKQYDLGLNKLGGKEQPYLSFFFNYGPIEKMCICKYLFYI